MVYTTKDFWLQTLERAIKTFCQTLLAAIGVEFVAIDKLNWVSILAVAATATVVSVLTSIVSSGIGERNTPSMVGLGTNTLNPTENASQPAIQPQETPVVSYTNVENFSTLVAPPKVDTTHRVPTDPTDIRPNATVEQKVEEAEKYDLPGVIVLGDN